MEQNFPSRKQAYLQEIQERYRPKQKKWWHTNTEAYHEPASLLAQSNWKANTENVYEFFSDTAYSALFGLIVIGVFFFMAKDDGTRIFLGIILLVIILQAIIPSFNKKVKLRFDIEGIHYNNNRSSIYWEDIVLLYIHKSYGDSYTNALLIHFYDSTAQKFVEKEIVLDGLNGEVPDICFAIEQCRHQQDALINSVE